MGDNRDGDGEWYQFRTQSFCANAAFSLYGVKKRDLLGGSCNRRHFINSFFTYGGADNLLKAVGVTPEVYSENNGGNAGRKLQENGEGQSEHMYGNAECVETNYNGGNNANRNLENGDGQGGYSSALGCDANGNYIIAAFKGSSCNGNYYVDSIDSMSDYNSQFGDIGCHAIFSNSFNTEDYSQEAVYALLRDSWACDTKLYPHSCPDPYGQKAVDDFALSTAARGGNGILAYNNRKIQKDVNIVSIFFLIAAACLSVVAYYMKNKRDGAKDESKDESNTVAKGPRRWFGKKKKKDEIEAQENSGDGEFKASDGVAA